MRIKYLDRAKEVLVVNLIKAIVSMPFGEERAKYASRTRTLALILREIATAKTAIYDSVMPGYVARPAHLGLAQGVRPDAGPAASQNR
ncbi:MAG: hypothetical protein FD149_254 [Rhodospirillaceae bacterium]|nr:MAG: hypothetical protein FD149_254 [Rhodospirillaceae bacterium]